MLTSYGEFEYAREAIKYQANEYVLKMKLRRRSWNRFCQIIRTAWRKQIKRVRQDI